MLDFMLEEANPLVFSAVLPKDDRTLDESGIGFGLLMISLHFGMCLSAVFGANLRVQ